MGRQKGKKKEYGPIHIPRRKTAYVNRLTRISIGPLSALDSFHGKKKLESRNALHFEEDFDACG